MKKFYPIGTVCKLDICDHFVMITGYFSNSYENGLVTYDYEGCIYPFGTLLNEKILFNENSIKNVIFIGYKNRKYTNFASKYIDVVEEKTEFEIEKQEKNDQAIYSDGDMTLIKNAKYNKLLIDNDGNVLIADETQI